MKVNIETLGAPKLPDDHYYRVQMLEVHADHVVVRVSIQKKTEHKIFGKWSVTRDKRLVSSLVRIDRAKDGGTPLDRAVREAEYLYKELFN